MNKKAQIAAKQFGQFIRLGLTIFVFIAIFYLIRQNIITTTDTSALEESIYYENLLQTIMKYDESTDKHYTNIISHFDTAYIDSRMKFSEEYKTELPSAKLTMNIICKKDKCPDNLQQIVYWNKIWFERLTPKTGLEGSQAPYNEKRILPFAYFEFENNLIPVELTIETIVPKR